MAAVPLLIVAAYNEAANLPSLCERAAGAWGGRPYRLLVVNDGSRDRTVELAAELAKRYPLRLISHPVNRGIAAVFLTGIRAALEEAGPDDPVAILEGDATSDPALLPGMCGALEDGADLVIASRYRPGGAYRNFPLKRSLLSHAANALLRLVCRVPGVTDYTIFYRVYRASLLKRALERYGDELTSVGGFACNAEMLLRMSRLAPRIREVPFVYDYGLKKGKSSMKVGKNLASYARLFRIFFAPSQPTSKA